MNTERLVELLTDLLALESERSVQTHLNTLNQHLGSLAGQPSHPDVQVQVSQSFAALDAQLSEIEAELSPAKLVRMEEISADTYFTTDLTANIRELIGENGMTPAVVQQKAAEMTSARAEYLAHLQTTLNGLLSLGFEKDELSQGEAEVGFQIPRDIFENELNGLISELRVLRRVVRSFSELATGSAEPIEVRQISTSNPMFFFGLDVQTVILIGLATTWALNTWKKVEDIRKVRAETAKLKGTFSPEEIRDIFDSRIETTIRAAITDEVNRLIPIADGQAGRPHEQRTDIKWSLDALLQRVERGMTVEVRMLPPPSISDDDHDETQADEAAAASFQQLENLKQQLVFPQVDAAPVLKLTRLPDNDNGPAKKTKRPTGEGTIEEPNGGKEK